MPTGATLTLLAPFARLATAAPNPDSRFVLVILRGGLDGLAAVPPYAEPAYAQLRGPLALAKPGHATTARSTSTARSACIPRSRICTRCIARARRSCCTPRPRRIASARTSTRRTCSKPAARRRAAAGGGWLNRALAALDSAGDARGAVALADSVPLVLRGELAVTSWAPSQLPETDEDTLARVRRLY